MSHVMFFSPPGTYPPAGLYTDGHFLLLGITLLLIAAGLFAARHAGEKTVRRILLVSVIALWVLEVCKILFVLLLNGSRNPNEFVPLYYCSLTLYAGLFSVAGRGWVRRLGDVFLATGGLIGGLSFLFCPNTSLPHYPTVHFISWHSFLLHGLMVFLALLLLFRLRLDLSLADIRYPVALVSVLCIVAYVFNAVYDRVSGRAIANLMFVSKNFPGTPVAVLYRVSGPLFPAAMWAIQSFCPFLAVYGLYKLFCRHRQINA